MTSVLQQGMTVGPYRVLRQLGAGGMGEVFLAADAELGRNIAIKLLPPHLAAEEDNLARLRQEARTASSLNHPNIITIYEIGRHEGGAFIAMEYIDGLTLRDMLAGGALPVRKAVQLAAQIADGLAAAHKRGLVHRDLKPENIMLTSDGVVKILDFGLAKVGAIAGSESQRASEAGTLVGTYAYMSPEQARAAEVDYRSDQFSFGSILYEMLAGGPAFAGASGVETLFMVVRDEPVPLSAVAPAAPAPLRWIVDRCLAKDPDERYASTRDLARDLQHLRDHFSETGAVSPLKTEGKLVKRLGWPVVASCLVAGLLIGGVVTAWVRRPAPARISTAHFLTYSGSDYSPAVSPDGKLIAFTSARDGIQRIWIKQVVGGSEVPLTAGRDDFPRFSPDGSTLLYAHLEDPTHAALYRVPVVGGESRRLLDRSGSGDFSPDGTKIAATRAIVSAEGIGSTIILLASADGSNVRELAKTDVAGAFHPRWSPDGKQIVLIGARGRVANTILIVDVATSATKILASQARSGEVSAAVWSRDGRSLIYTRAQSVEAVVGSSAEIIRHDIRSDVAEVIGWSSQNGTLLDVLEDGKLVLDARSPRDNLRELSLDGTKSDRWITRGNSSDRQPVYAPDGKSVLFSSNRSGNLDLWQLSNDGTVRKITDDAADDWDPAFTPDGKKIVWSSARSGNLEVWIANADGSEARQVSHDGVDAENPAATRDGWIVYNSFNPKKLGVWKVRQDGTQPLAIVSARAAVPEVSPDGQYVAYIGEGRTVRAAIHVVRITDGADTGFLIPLRTVRRTAAIIGRSRWMPDGRTIAFLGQDAEGTNGIFAQDFAAGRDTTATRRQLGGFDRERATESFGISGDGKAMTVAGWEQLFSLFTIDGLPGVTAKRTEKREN